LKIEIVNNISAIAEQDWQRLSQKPSVFSNYQFLQCLETSGSVSGAQGWQPHHLQLRDNDKNEINAILPMYIKSHSWGEYVFDWA